MNLPTFSRGVYALSTLPEYLGTSIENGAMPNELPPPQVPPKVVPVHA